MGITASCVAAGRMEPEAANAEATNAAGADRSARRAAARSSVLDEGRGVACVLLLLLDRLLFLRRVPGLLLVFLWRLMGHGTLLLSPFTVAAALVAGSQLTGA